jgi:hypothetical protein
MAKTELADWEKKHEDLHNIIEKLGFEDGSQLPPPVPRLPHPPSDQMKAELQNQVAVLLRMILINNDGSISPRKLPRF